MKTYINMQRDWDVEFESSMKHTLEENISKISKIF